MHGLTMAAVLQVAMLATSMNDYQTAYNRAEAAGKPLLVLVGEAESPDYRQLKQETLPELIRLGALDNMVITEVERDAKPDLTRQLVRGDALPQLVLYTPVTKKTWRRTHVSGAPTEREIQTFLVREISKGLEVAAKSRDKKPSTVSQIPDAGFTFSTGSS